MREKEEISDSYDMWELGLKLFSTQDNFTETIMSIPICGKIILSRKQALKWDKTEREFIVLAVGGITIG